MWKYWCYGRKKQCKTARKVGVHAPPPVLDIVDKSRHFVIGIQVSGPLVYSDFI